MDSITPNEDPAEESTKTKKDKDEPAHEIEEMDITDVPSYSESESSDYSSSRDSFDDDNTSQCSDVRVINEVSSRQIPVKYFEEGKAKIQVPISFNVFFNPVQEFNRDISVAVLTLFAEDHFKESEERHLQKKKKKKDPANQSYDNVPPLPLDCGIRYKDGIEILEALSATGLRSIRYALEVPGVKQITANDMSRSAVLNIEDNVQINGVEDLVITSQSDAVWLMQQQKADNLWFDAIDLDPYGCPSKFLDSAVNSIRDGGLLLVTCTDMAVLAGNTPESCYSKYGAISLRNPACHEMALRIALQCIESHCNRYGRYIVPLLSFSADFYIRLFVKVYSSPQICKRSLSKLSNVFQCNGCSSLTLQPLGSYKDNGNNQFKYTLPNGPVVNETCSHCSHRHHMGGPIWNGPIHNSIFIKRLIELTKKSLEKFKTGKRMLGMFTVIDEEVPDTPLYYTINALCNRIHCESMPLKEFRSALLNGGFRVSMSHCASNSIKTDAPSSVIWDILRCWIKTHPVAEKRMQDPVCANLLKKEPEFIANFSIHPEALPESIKSGLLRYQPNPAPNWGPGCRSKPNILKKSEESKRQTHQNKRKRSHNKAAGLSSKLSNGQNSEIPIVTLSDDEEPMNSSKEHDRTSNNEDSSFVSNKKQKLTDSSNILDSSIEIEEHVNNVEVVSTETSVKTSCHKIISIDDEEENPNNDENINENVGKNVDEAVNESESNKDSEQMESSDKNAEGIDDSNEVPIVGNTHSEESERKSKSDGDRLDDSSCQVLSIGCEELESSVTAVTEHNQNGSGDSSSHPSSASGAGIDPEPCEKNSEATSVQSPLNADKHISEEKPVSSPINEKDEVSNDPKKCDKNSDTNEPKMSNSMSSETDKQLEPSDHISNNDDPSESAQESSDVAVK